MPFIPVRRPQQAKVLDRGLDIERTCPESKSHDLENDAIWLRPISRIENCYACVLVYTRNWPDRKSTRLNSSHQIISYAVFCLKKKKKRRQKSATTLYITREDSCTSLS